MAPFRICAINPGSTSTKAAVFEDETQVCGVTVRHTRRELDACRSVEAQLGLRLQVVEDFLAGKGIRPESLDAVVGRGGLVEPIDSGTYIVNEAMLRDLTATASEHAASLGGASCGAAGGARGRSRIRGRPGGGGRDGP